MGKEGGVGSRLAHRISHKVLHYYQDVEVADNNCEALGETPEQVLANYGLCARSIPLPIFSACELRMVLHFK